MASSVRIDYNIQRLCRLCFLIGEIDLFSTHEEAKDIHDKIYECFQVSLPYEKNKPSSICKTCLEELYISHNFRVKCLTSNERFKKYWKEIGKSNAHREEMIAVASSISYETSDTDNSYYVPNVNHITNNTTKQGGIVIETDKSECNFKCNMCNKVLKTKTSLVKHYTSMHEKRKHIGKVSGNGAARRYHCTACSYSTPHSQTLVNHMRRHNGERPYSCECGKNFTQSSSLAAHRKTHSTATYFTCALCGKQFKHAFAMKNHLRVHENGIFSCSVCFKTLKSKQSLQSHIRRHYNICNYNCEDCGDTFVTSSELLNHRRKHSLEKNIECHLCGYKTHTKKNLIIHLKRHTGNRSFKCNTCHVAFYTQSNLQRHQRVHTRDKPFSCPTCSQKFSYSPSLNKHMKTVHGVDYKWADFKWKGTKTSKFSMKTDVMTCNKT
ncbi:unnamed protein product [Arctia plantaginis]|uniref:Uncharacterized protein n=1 Tax=Arctia plantaginis TaxID=874455 RepID=A0A8S1B706_ARCPL|nr:unnamed protein product [Arctia plantaginis]